MSIGSMASQCIACWPRRVPGTQRALLPPSSDLCAQAINVSQTPSPDRTDRPHSPAAPHLREQGCRSHYARQCCTWLSDRRRVRRQRRVPRDRGRHLMFRSANPPSGVHEPSWHRFLLNSGCAAQVQCGAADSPAFSAVATDYAPAHVFSADIAKPVAVLRTRRVAGAVPSLLLVRRKHVARIQHGAAVAIAETRDADWEGPRST